jgi:transcriptional regulator of arginine metabolism
MQKQKRLLAIEKIIMNESIPSQMVLNRKLKKEGLSCTQATLSRNLRQLGVIRVPDGKGAYKYSIQRLITDSANQEQAHSLVSVIRQIIDANSMVLLKTRPGYANSVAVMIDGAGRYEVAGTIAGDDTLLVIPRDRISIRHLHSCLEIIFPGLHRIARTE